MIDNFSSISINFLNFVNNNKPENHKEEVSKYRRQDIKIHQYKNYCSIK